MSINHHKLYMDDVFALAKTLSIKSEYSARQMNLRLVQTLGAASVDESDPQSWKYNRNLCGLYHSSDTPMQVISLDTLEVIDFTKDNLRLHTATAQGYEYAGRYYKELLAKHPTQETLIKGILYPASMEDVLGLPDHSVVSFNPTKVEPNEETLVGQLSEYARHYFHRWWVSGFNTTHPLYAASFYGVFYQSLVTKIVELRDKACHTAQAHSFHVRMHLASNHGLDAYLPHLSQKQAMWLYRNIEYIQRHVGSQSTFEWLVEHILTERGLPLVGYDLVHDTQGFAEGAVLPRSVYLAKAVNSVRAAPVKSVDESVLRNKIASMAEGNPEYDLREPRSVTDTNSAVQNRFATKILESAFVDISENSATSSVEMAVSLWVYSACTERMNLYTRVNHPLTGEEIALSVLDAYYLFLHAYASAHSGGLVTLPPLRASSAPVWPRPSLESLWGLCEQAETPIERIEQMHLLMPGQRQFLNLDQYRQALTELEDAANYHSLIIASADTFEKQSSYKSVFGALWQDQEFSKAETGTSAIEYFVSKDIDPGALESAQWQELYLSLFSSVTGLSMETTAQQSQMQTAMVAIMRKLSSYSVFYIDPTSGTSIRSLGWSNLVVQEASTSFTSLYEVPIVAQSTSLVASLDQLSYQVPIESTTIAMAVSTPEAAMVSDYGSSIVFLSEEHSDRREISIGHVGATPINTTGESDESFVIGLAETLLDLEAFATVPNAYNSDCYPRPSVPTQANLDDWTEEHLLLSIEPPLTSPNLFGDFRVLNIPQRLRYFAWDSNVYILDGIYANYGSTDASVFESFVGSFAVDSFQHLPFFEYSVPAWKSNIGNLLEDPMDVHAGNPDVLELQGLQGVHQQVTTTLAWSESAGFLHFKLYQPGSTTFTMTFGTDGLELGLQGRNYQITHAPWKVLTVETMLRFQYQTPYIQLESLTFNGRPIEGAKFTNHARSYTMLPFVQHCKQAKLDGFYHYGDTKLAAFTDWGAAHNWVIDPQLEFTNHSATIQVTEPVMP